ncbi:MAG: response regulator transcription factor [Pseudotabrizicola sp.]|uniref:response regulator transcription factor n=1 Tax=Pseudotabrizicola sp. TaxID=2939647 RepID=UPI0027305571|nr:response regulator transcription factor [Pseudotabrizicola sp.]MDP2081127.1 response regulator transcription factor [Pseudotabrizicola sp.]MDZ7574545.1 response regulator transcription factor [Pseudotabrizicola sp.]
MQILLVEDEARVADFVRRGLRAEGWTIDHASSAEDGLEMMASTSYDVVLLDVMLPQMSGDEMCRQLRARRNDVPILMLSAMASTEDRVGGLRSGADDYLAKPFEFDELVARVEALYRRRTGHSAPDKDHAIVLGLLSYDPASMQIKLVGRNVDLTTKERDVLVMLMRNKGKVLARERLLNAVWSMDSDPLTNVVDVTVSRIRRKLGDAGAMIVTIRNYGYRLDSE